MAFTVSNLVKGISGNQRKMALAVTTDGAEGEVTTGLSYIDDFTLSPGSFSTGTAIPHVFINQLSSGTASVGTLSISGATSGDKYFITVYGR